MRLIQSLVLCSMLAGSAVYAQSEVSCDDLTQIANGLDEVSAAFNQLQEIHEGDEVDQALGQIVDVLQMLAEHENDDALTNSVNNLVDSFNNMNAQDFEVALKQVTAGVDRLNRRDCH